MIKGFMYEEEFNKARRVTTKSGRVLVPFVMFESPDSKYSNYSIKEDTPKGEGGLWDIIGNPSIQVKNPPQE